jgi:membrane protease subunit (stomatin/prohibitin family)
MIFNKLMGQFVDVIQWTDDSPDTMVWRFERQGNEIKYGAKLTVREGQTAVFVNEGEIADTFTPGMYELFTRNLPILSTLQAWPHGFESPIKAEVYFCSSRIFTDLKWGTKNPVIARDPEFGPVRLRAFGTYAFKVNDPATFLRELVATDPSFEAYEVTNQFRNAIVSRFVDVVGSSRIPILDLAGNYEKVSKLANEKIAPELAKMGIVLTQFFVENISLPPEVEAALDKRSQMGILGNLDQYAKYQSAEAIRDAAQNPGGIAGIGAGIGAGMVVGQQMAGAVGGSLSAPGQVIPGNTQSPGAPPPLPVTASFHAAINGAQAGPFDMTAMQMNVREGKISRSTLVWKPGMANWAAADTVPELQPLFAHLPPPLPT